jgi:hypothetical protein
MTASPEAPPNRAWLLAPSLVVGLAMLFGHNAWLAMLGFHSDCRNLLFQLHHSVTAHRPGLEGVQLPPQTLATYIS